MKYFLACLLLFISLISYGQDKFKIDSLKSLLKSTKVSSIQAQLNLEISKLYTNSSRDTSKIFAKKAEKMALRRKNNSLLEKIYLQLGIVNYKQQKDVIALNYFNKIDSLHNLVNSFSKAYFMTKIYRSEISKFKFTLQGVMQAKKYLLQALVLAKKNNDTELINLVKYNLAEWHGFISQEVSPKEHLDSATTLINEVIPYYNTINNYRYLAKSFHTLASIAMEIKEYKNAESNYKKRLQIIKKMKIPERLGEAYFSLGSFYRKLKEPDKGLSYLDSASIYYNKIGFSSDGYQKDLYKEYAYLYEEKKQYKKAFENIQKAFVLKDKIYEQENTKKAMELEKKYQSQIQEHKISLLRTEKQEQRNLLFGGITLSTLTGLFFFIIYRNKQKTTKKLLELDNAKSNFFTNISHEFRTPLGLISGPIQQQLKNKNLKDEDRKNLEMMHRNSTRLLSLVDQLLDISKIEAGSFQLQINEDKLMPFIGTLTDSFTYVAQQEDISYIVNNNPTEIQTYFDKDLIEKIIVNLLSNAIKYTPVKGSVICNFFVKDSNLHLEIKNTGEGLPQEALIKIFDRFYQTDQNKQGVGIGLALVKELVKLHKGTITVESIPDEWTTFTVILPINKESFKVRELVTTPNVEQPIQVKTSKREKTGKHDNAGLNSENIKEEAPILLIVDDNADIRTYVSNLFKKTYTVITAKNGQEGVAMAIEQIPDLIISDIMMPIKNGIELCNTLKVDERTSHIPIILLTAKAGEENEIAGIKTGADDYITKPFHEDLLQLRVEKLIESREKLQQRYSQEVILRPKDIAITPIDEQFLERIQNVLDNKLVESSFNIEDFSKAVGMSRMQLHRKLKALTGLSASEFIRSQRLKLASQLLKKSEINVSQVGYSVGFNNHNYFSKCFKEMYHCTPTEYALKDT